MTSAIANVTLPGPSDLAVLSPELMLVGAVTAILLGAAVRGKRTVLIPLLAIVACFAAAGLAAAMSAGLAVQSTAFSKLIVPDRLACFVRMLIYSFTGLLGVMWMITARYRPGEKSAANAPEFFTLLLSAAVGMGLMASTGNLLMVLIALELASLPSYALAGFQKDKRPGAEAALKYVVFGAAAAAVMVYGISLLYGVYSTLDAGAIASGIRDAGGTIPLAGVIGLIALGLGLAFKISAFPMHFWCPDVFEGANVEVTTFLSVASKAAALTLLLRLALTIAGFAENAAATATAPTPAAAVAVGAVIAAVAALTATVGNLAAMAQNNLKRLLAYCYIAHAGYMLMGVAILSGRTGVAAILLYLLVYLFMNLGAFSVVALVFNATGREDLAGLSGLGRRNPLLAACMTLFLVSLIGIPPMAGFFAKYQLFYALFVHKLQWLVAVGLVNTLFSLFYYMRIVKAMYLERSDAPPLRVPAVGLVWVVILAVPVTVLAVVWQPLTYLAEKFSRVLGAP
ncbi:MAG: NADH-quinone oxidoreductase subunit N [Planctomycetota bacterium]|nr:NADH-quinone oxidoreductase subunit N [Planctomycetota bacterium]